MKKFWFICICLVSWSRAMVIIQLKDSPRNNQGYALEIEPSKKNLKALLVYLVTKNIVKILRDNCLDQKDDDQKARQLAFDWLVEPAIDWLTEKVINRCIPEQNEQQSSPEDSQQIVKKLIVQKVVEYLVPSAPEENQCAMILNFGHDLLTEQLSKEFLARFATKKTKDSRINPKAKEYLRKFLTQ
jgi:hypothetical protein